MTPDAIHQGYGNDRTEFMIGGSALFRPWNAFFLSLYVNYLADANAAFAGNAFVNPTHSSPTDGFAFGLTLAVSLNDLPAVQSLDGLSFAPVTYFIGENGSGKSTILEAIAVAAGFNAEGGTINFNFSTRRSESPLHDAIRLTRGPRRPRTGFFLRAESFFNLATEIERLDAEPSFGPPVIDSYGGRSLHEQSHGESFLALVKHRFGADGFYILDEPEAALSPTRQLSLLVRMHDLLADGCQFIIATHAPIVLAYPGAVIYQLDERGISAVAYDDTEHVQLTRDFMRDRHRFLNRILAED